MATLTTSGAGPTPRDALDTGSVAELAQDGREVLLDLHRARPWATEHHGIAVPDDAFALLDGLGTYGS
jgi:hypothetical protein